MNEPLLVVGNGMATARFVEELLARARGRYALTVVGEEPCLAYNRALLSAVLARDVLRSDIVLQPAQWWREHGVALVRGQAAVAIDPHMRCVRLADDTMLSYSSMVLATGSQPVRLAVPGMDLAGVLTFRDLRDVAMIMGAAAPGSKAVVIGGGLLGLEAAYGLAKAGARVDVVHVMDRLLERQLDHRAAAMLRRAIEAKGIAVHLDADTAALRGVRRVEAVELADGRVIEADVVIVAVGIRPSVALARSAGLRVNRGIVVDDGLASSIDGIYAIGECTEHRGVCYGLVEPVHEQATILARRFAGDPVSYPGSVLAANLKVSGVHLFSAGDFMGAGGTETIVLRDAGLDTYRKLVIADGRLVGVLLYGDTEDGLWYLDLIRSGASVERYRGDLVFGRTLVERSAA